MLRLIQKYRTLITSTCVQVANFYLTNFANFYLINFRQFLSDQFCQLLQDMVSWNQIEQRIASVITSEQHVLSLYSEEIGYKATGVNK